MRVRIRLPGFGRRDRKGRAGKRRKRGARRVAARLPLRRLAPASLVLVALAATTGFVWVDRSIVQRFEARGTSFPSRVYARPWSASPGDRVDPAALRRRLERSGYSETNTTPDRPGEFRVRGGEWTVFLRSADTARGHRPAALVRLAFGWRDRLQRVMEVESATRLPAFELAPEPLLTFYDDVREERRRTALAEIPQPLRQAVEMVEDRRFRSHHGVDLAGIARALVANVRAGGVVQGGSTITQQLAKNLWGPGPRTVRRKALEAVAALALELHYDKDRILEAYLNEVYLGQVGPVAVSGVGDASRFFFGLQVSDLDLPRSALLAGIIRNPGSYNPRRHPGAARRRRDLVLGLMAEQGAIDASRLDAARAAPLGVVERPPLGERFPWIEDWLAAELAALVGEDDPARAGYSIFTTFDAEIQRAAREALRRGLERIERRLGAKEGTPPLEGAVVVLDPHDGSLLALVGGRDWQRSQFNRALSARRPPGSTFKPFVFLAALERTLSEPEFGFTAATRLDDSPLEVTTAGRVWRPANFDRQYHGEMSARAALERSVNVPTVRAALQVGLDRVVEVAHRCGIDSPLDAVPALALGSEEVAPLELAGAYATLAAGGRRAAPHGIVALQEPGAGEPQPVAQPAPRQVVDEALAYVITDVLAGVVERGTARSASALGLSGPAAGKTGSSDGLRDAWFVGYTPSLLALVWVGYDDNRPVGMTGSAAALPVWVELMRAADRQAESTFPRPRGVVREWIDPETGALATRRCQRAYPELFVRGTEPTERCELHGEPRRRGLWRWLTGRSH